MAVGREERERQLDDLKDHYQEQFSKTIDDAKTAHRFLDGDVARETS